MASDFPYQSIEVYNGDTFIAGWFRVENLPKNVEKPWATLTHTNSLQRVDLPHLC